MNSIFGIGVLEFIFILIFALIFLGPDRLPRVTREVLQFIRRLQTLSKDLRSQVNEEIGDLRELDPSYHMKELMEDEDDEKEKESDKSAGRQAAATGQTSTPSQPAAAPTANGAADGKEEEAKSIAPQLSETAKASANGRQQSEGSAKTKPSSTASAIPSAPSSAASKSPTRNSAARSASRSPGAAGKRGVKTLSQLRKQQLAKRKSSSSDANSTYLVERNKRAHSRADERRDAVASRKTAQASEVDEENAAPDEAAARGSDDGLTQDGGPASGEPAPQTRPSDTEEETVAAFAPASEDRRADIDEERQA